MVQVKPELLQKIVGHGVAGLVTKGQVGGELNDALHEICLVVDRPSFNGVESNIGEGVKVSGLASLESFQDVSFRLWTGPGGDAIGGCGGCHGVSSKKEAQVLRGAVLGNQADFVV